MAMVGGLHVYFMRTLLPLWWPKGFCAGERGKLYVMVHSDIVAKHGLLSSSRKSAHVAWISFFMLLTVAFAFPSKVYNVESH